MNYKLHKIQVLLRHKTRGGSGRAVENYLVPDIQSRFKTQKKFFRHVICTQQPQDLEYKTSLQTLLKFYETNFKYSNHLKLDLEEHDTVSG